MQLSRRDLMKFGVLGSAALLLPIERLARTQLLLNDRMPNSGLPKPFELDWRVPARRRPDRHERQHRPLRHPLARGAGRRPRALQEPEPAAHHHLGLRRHHARPDDQGPARPPCRGAPRPGAARLASRPAVSRDDVGAPPRLGLAAAVRRLRERHHLAGPVQGLLLPQLPGRADALVPRPRHPPHGEQRLHGPRRAVPHHRRGGRSQARPADRPVRPAAGRPRRDVRQERRAHLLRQQRVGRLRGRRPRQRRAVADDARRAAQVPLPDPQREHLALLRVPPQQRAPRCGLRHRRRPDEEPAGGRAFRHGMAERYEVIIDFKGMEGQTVVLNDSQEQHRLRQHEQGHAVRRRRDPGQGRRERRSPTTRRNARGHRPATVRGSTTRSWASRRRWRARRATLRVRAPRTATGRSTARRGGSHRERLRTTPRHAEGRRGGAGTLENKSGAGSTRSTST